MRVRAIDVNHDWLYGKGQNDYLTGNSAVIQNINTRLNSFLGDCFFDTGAGVDWFNLLGAKDQLALNLAVTTVILNTKDVVGLTQLSISRNAARAVTIRYVVQTARLSTASGFFVFVTPSTEAGGGDVKSKVITVTFASESFKDINVGLYALNARLCEVTVIDPSSTYTDVDFQKTRPDVNTIRITAGGPISGTFEVLIFQAGS